MFTQTRKLLAAVGMLSIAAMPVFAARADVGTSGAAFLKLNAGARPAAMGEAFGAVANDVNAIYYNPAGSALLERPEFTAQYGSWFQSIGYNALGFVYPTESAGSFGLAVVNLSVTDIERRVADTIDPEGKFGASDYAYMLTYGKKLGERLAVGANVKLISQKLDDQSASAYAGDAGLLWSTPWQGFSAGLAVQNLGSSVKFINDADPLPMNIKAGLGYVAALGAKADLTVALDVNMPRDNDTSINAGFEYKRFVFTEFSAAFRGGYKTMSQEKLGGLSGLSAGAGITWRQFGLDFAWVPYGDLGDTFRYSLVMKF